MTYLCGLTVTSPPVAMRAAGVWAAAILSLSPGTSTAAAARPSAQTASSLAELALRSSAFLHDGPASAGSRCRGCARLIQTQVPLRSCPGAEASLGSFDDGGRATRRQLHPNAIDTRRRTAAGESCDICIAPVTTQRRRSAGRGLGGARVLARRAHEPLLPGTDGGQFERGRSRQTVALASRPPGSPSPCHERFCDFPK